MSNPTDTNQASEGELSSEVDDYIDDIRYNNEVPFDERLESAKKSIKYLIRTEKLKLLDEVIHQSTVNLKSARAVAGWAEIRKKQLEAEL